MHIAFLHTAAVHTATFDTLLAKTAPQTRATHVVRPDLLALARADGLAAVRTATHAALAELAQADAVLCTCSTLGPLVDEAGLPHALRIDRPMMEATCSHGPDVALAVCLQSTAEPSLALLKDCAARAGVAIRPQLVLCDAAWPRFEAGDQDGFARAIADAITAEVPEGRCVVLAQASMAIAAPLLHARPALASPPLAVERCVAIAGRPR